MSTLMVILAALLVQARPTFTEESHHALVVSIAWLAWSSAFASAIFAVLRLEGAL